MVKWRTIVLDVRASIVSSGENVSSVDVNVVQFMTGVFALGKRPTVTPRATSFGRSWLFGRDEAGGDEDTDL